MKTVMMIGFGTMAKEVISRLPAEVSVGWIVAHPHHHPAIQAEFGGAVVALASPTDCQQKPDLVVECASQQAVRDYGEPVLQRGWPLAVISTGALTDNDLVIRLVQASHESGARFQVLSGAIAGMDGLAAAREAGLDYVTYISNKSPASWRGSHAEALVDLANVLEPILFFSGTAREAASLFPANANVAATIALIGIGMDKTQVQLRVDPHTQRNTHQIKAGGTFGEMQIQLSGNPLARNPKTSMLAALSVVQACRQLLGGI